MDYFESRQTERQTKASLLEPNVAFEGFICSSQQFCSPVTKTSFDIKGKRIIYGTGIEKAQSQKVGIPVGINEQTAYL